MVRYGHLPEREVQTGIGSVPVKMPRVRDRAPEGAPLRFTSTILPPYLRRARSIEELMAWLCRVYGHLFVSSLCPLARNAS